jgi:membrane fusion protein (multidrug efflux system)
VLNTISSDNPIVADFVIDQKEIFHFNQLLHQPKAKNDSTFSFVFSGQEYKEYGSLYVMDRAVNAQTGTLTVRVLFPNPQGLLRVGMSGTVRVLNLSAKSSVLIPYKAVTEQLGEFFVYKVNLDSSKVSQQRITLGKPVGRNVIVYTGLQEGETIVIEGVQALREGSKVNLNAAKPEAKK